MPNNLHSNYNMLAEIREVGPYSSRNASKGSLLDELYLLVTTYTGEFKADKIRSFIMEANGLNKKTYENRRVIWNRLKHRYFSIAPSWIGRSLAIAAKAGLGSSDFFSLAFLYFSLRDKTTFDFIIGPVWDKWQSDITSIGPEDFHSYLHELDRTALEVAKWGTNTRNKMASITLTALRDFGLLRGKATKNIQRPPISDETTYHLLAILWAEGKRGNTILEASDWHIFLWTDADVANALSRLAQKRWIRFERSGQTVILEMIRMPELGE